MKLSVKDKQRLIDGLMLVAETYFERPEYIEQNCGICYNATNLLELGNSEFYFLMHDLDRQFMGNDTSVFTGEPIPETWHARAYLALFLAEYLRNDLNSPVNQVKIYLNKILDKITDNPTNN
jgi:hypothetical protein